MKSKSVSSNVIEVCELDKNSIENMYKLFSKYFVSKKETFIEDLNEKDYVIIIRNSRNDNIIGFSSIEYINLPLNNENIKIIYSGDTIVDENFRNESDLLKIFVNFNLQKLSNENEIYWYLISMGFRTYRFLPVFFKEFWPRYDNDTPSKIKKIIDSLGKMKFENQYLNDKGIIVQETECYLRTPYVDIPNSRLKNPHIKFFLEKNPGYIKGNELACLTKFSLNNFKPIIFKRFDIDY